MATSLAVPSRGYAHPSPHPVAVPVRYLVRPSFQPREAALWDVSRRGARLLAADALEPGMTVLLELPGPESSSPSNQLARVTSAECAGEQGHFVQCRFARPLDTQGLSLILRGLPHVGC
jgi:hypothetical protein